MSGPAPEPSEAVANRIAAARDRQTARNGRVPNARIAGRVLREACGLAEGSVARAVLLAEREGLSGRGTDRLLRVARTIADLSGDAVVGAAHLDEAARFRAPVDRMAVGRAG